MMLSTTPKPKEIITAVTQELQKDSPSQKVAKDLGKKLVAASLKEVAPGEGESLGTWFQTAITKNSGGLSTLGSSLVSLAGNTAAHGKIALSRRR